jgi:hypothetical protein
LVPSAEDAPAVPPVPDFNSHGVDHYNCYRAKVTKNTAGVPKGTTIAVADLFSATARDLVVKKPKHVCVPVDREGDGIKNHDAYLVCYGAKPGKGQPKHAPQAGLQVANPLSTLVGATVKEGEAVSRRSAFREEVQPSRGTHDNGFAAPSATAFRAIPTLRLPRR